MKTKSARKNKVNVITLGCSKNIYDSEVLMGQLKANDFDVSHESEKDEAEIVIINTCGFIDNAKQESIDTILRFARAKEEGIIEKLIVTGCLSERYKPELKKEIPNVDEFFGTRDLPFLLKSLGADYKHELIGERLLTTPRHFAYLKISEGCDRPCSFCAIPLMRGKHISIPTEDLVSQTQQLAANGTKELILIAQDLTYYGLDIYNSRKLAELLRKLSDINGIEWIRLHYTFPSGFPLDVLDVMNERSNICKYLDMPLQHISDRILASMRRGITREKSDRLISTIRDKVPGIAIRTTLIAGYPGETEKEYEEMKEWVESSRFERLGIFAYSHEENTHAYKYQDDVPDDVKANRISEIMDIQQQISSDLNEQLCGQELKVLIDRKDGNFFIGRTEHDSPEVDNEVLIDAQKHYCRIGDFVNVKILSSTDFDLFAEPV
ncbi:MAG: 30S ribosomal protein S12 methylthiotransferase RimO [Bacteroidetes bacterium]|nr:MAG: 30S ribosomal protein S12 methylthiotransferase RimO [Bacteroidota bacterium]REJ99848.1 MAG: 30S ribosomal protein S12 methylthiotransferase RimO [Bacteroidota bacterium]REK34221.1 MAG: 30S ribosomal protein S12 methylthiotransferase RimO [Bacteroidota bacterium]REK50551.1 MAG: 30S ribosomal protein S12 methylthiotransferase RimO [Bacteroidota bacterium]